MQRKPRPSLGSINLRWHYSLTTMAVCVTGSRSNCRGETAHRISSRGISGESRMNGPEISRENFHFVIHVFILFLNNFFFWFLFIFFFLHSWHQDILKKETWLEFFQLMRPMMLSTTKSPLRQTCLLLTDIDNCLMVSKHDVTRYSSSVFPLNCTSFEIDSTSLTYSTAIPSN